MGKGPTLSAQVWEKSGSEPTTVQELSLRCLGSDSKACS